MVGSKHTSFYAVMQFSFAFMYIPSVICRMYCRFDHLFRIFQLNSSLKIPLLHFFAFDNSLILRMDLTPRKQAQIVALSKHPKKSVREIGKELGTPKSTVGRVVKRSNDSDDVTI